MSQQDYFRNALSDFTYEAASGAAIRHLADLGCTVRQISDKLTYPTPYERVRRTVWQQLLDTRVVLTEAPGSGRAHVKAEYMMERDKYGRTSFRLAKSSVDGAGEICWKERRYREERDGSPAVYLADRCSANGEENAYISCDFGLVKRKEPERYQTVMQLLNERQKEYIEGLMWEEKICYHRLDQRMREIAVRLYEAGQYEGVCYFLKTEERVELPAR